MRNNKPSAWRDILEILAFFAVCAFLIWLMLAAIRAITDYVRAEAADGQLKADIVNEGDGVGRATACLNGVLLLGGETDVPVRSTVLRVYTDGVDNPMPEWWNPGEPMAVEWYAEDHFAEAGNMVEAEPHPPVGVDSGGIDWNIETDIHGWDGHTMTGVELDLFSRITYLEFFGTSEECMNAGIDSILNLWNSEYFGRTLFETLSATAENGALVYTTYGYAYDWDYDYTALEEIKALCLVRFVEGPKYNCCFFQLYGFPAWAEPLFEIDSVYFSTFKEGTWN